MFATNPVQRPPSCLSSIFCSTGARQAVSTAAASLTAGGGTAAVTHFALGYTLLSATTIIATSTAFAVPIAGVLLYKGFQCCLRPSATEAALSRSLLANIERRQATEDRLKNASEAEKRAFTGQYNTAKAPTTAAQV